MSESYLLLTLSKRKSWWFSLITF